MVTKNDGITSNVVIGCCYDRSNTYNITTLYRRIYVNQEQLPAAYDNPSI